MMQDSNNRSDGQKSGFIAVVGLANAGKSTLVNLLVGHKVAIVSPKAQTTRHRINGIVHTSLGQAVLVDTPGVPQATQKSCHKALSQAMQRAWQQAVTEADAVLVVIDIARLARAGGVAGPVWRAHQMMLRTVQAAKQPCIVALNKIDLLSDKKSLLPLIRDLNAQLADARCTQAAYVPISAAVEARRRFGIQAASNALAAHPKSGQTCAIDALVQALFAALPSGPPYFAAGTVTDQTHSFICAEIVRETALHLLQQEVPHGLYVRTQDYQHSTTSGGKPLLRVHCTVCVDKASHLGIVVGKGGEMIKKIGQHARLRLEKQMATQVFLRLQARTASLWARDARQVQELGFGRPAGGQACA